MGGCYSGFMANRASLPTAVAFFVSFALVGCAGLFGGSGGGAGSTGTTGTTGTSGTAGSALVQVVLPTGMAPADAVAVTAGGSVPVTGGEQSLAVVGDTETLVTIIEASSGRLISLGLVKSGGTGEVLDSTDAALGLLHLGLGLFEETGSRRTELLDQVRGSAAVATLAGVIATEWQTNRFALDQPSPGLKSALKTALSTIGNGVLRSRTETKQIDLSQVHEGRGRDVGLRAGIYAAIGENVPTRLPLLPTQHQINNEATNGYKLLSNTTTPSSLITVNFINGAYQVFDGPRTVDFLGEDSSTDFRLSEVVYLEVPEGQDEESYRAFSLSGSFSTQISEIDQGTLYQVFQPTLDQERARLRQMALMRIFGEMVLDAAGVPEVKYTRENLAAMIESLKLAGGVISTGVEASTQPGDALGILDDMLGAMAANDDITLRALQGVKLIAGEAGPIYLTPESLNAGRIRAIRAVLALYNTVGISETLGDYSVKVTDLFRTPPVTFNDVRAFRADVDFDPAVDTFIPGEALVTFLRVTGAQPGDQFVYRYKVEAGIGITLNSANSTGTEIESNSDRLQIRTSGSTSDEVVIRGEALKRNEQNQLVSVGVAIGVYRQTGEIRFRMLQTDGENGFKHLSFQDEILKESTGRNRWKGGRYRLATFRNGLFWGSTNFTIPEYVGRPFSRNLWIRNYPAKQIKDNDGTFGTAGVGIYDLGDRFLILRAYADLPAGTTPNYGAILSSWNDLITNPGSLGPHTAYLRRLGD